ncbi:hypothetical protein ABIV32_001567 [Salmonella enterica subsp. enterica]
MTPVMAKDIVFTKKSTSPAEFERRILERIETENLPLIYLGFLGEFKSSKTRIALLCECGRRADKSIDNFLNNGRVCKCQRGLDGREDLKGFKKGENYLYVMKSGDIGKVGVTSDIKSRLYNLESANDLKLEIVYSRKYPTREQALEKERLIKRVLIAGGAGGLNTGFTETFPYNTKTLNNIKNLSL